MPTMSDQSLFPVPPGFAGPKTIDAAAYDRLYRRSVEEPDAFWAEQGKIVDWIKPFTKVKNTSFTGDVSIKWFEDGVLNAAANCIDRHLATRADQTAIIWEGDDPNTSRTITYRELHEQVSKFANVMKGRGVKKGDRVTIYLPMIPEAAWWPCWPAPGSEPSAHGRSSVGSRADSPGQPDRGLRRGPW